MKAIKTSLPCLKDNNNNHYGFSGVDDINLQNCCRVCNERHHLFDQINVILRFDVNLCYPTLPDISVYHLTQTVSTNKVIKLDLPESGQILNFKFEVPECNKNAFQPFFMSPYGNSIFFDNLKAPASFVLFSDSDNSLQPFKLNMSITLCEQKNDCNIKEFILESLRLYNLKKYAQSVLLSRATMHLIFFKLLGSSGKVTNNKIKNYIQSNKDIEHFKKNIDNLIDSRNSYLKEGNAFSCNKEHAQNGLAVAISLYLHLILSQKDGKLDLNN